MAASAAPRQLALALDHAVSFAREDILSGPSNEAALALIDGWPDWPNRTMALVGPHGAGKSHIAAIWAERSGARTLGARLLADVDLPATLATGALVLEDLSPQDLSPQDLSPKDLSSDGLGERALFHLLNLAREERAFVLLTARSLPAGWPVTIRDLASRLRALPVVALAPPDDTLLRALIVKLAADRQINLDETLVTYLVNRVDRSFAGVHAAISRLDEEALRQHRPVTKVLAAELFRDSVA